MDPRSVEQIDPRIRQVKDRLEVSFSAQLSFEDIARKVNLSTSRLRHLFKEQIGKTPWQYVKALRMKEPKRLADHSFLSVKQIMYRVGLHDESHFVRDFKSTYGVTITKSRQTTTGNH
jgi:AraC-like DNA-binding protein